MANTKNLYSGCGCPECVKGFQTSFFEYCILLSLRKIYGDENVVHRDKSLIGKEIDIYVPSMKIAFEPGGWFWHKSKLDDDYDKQKQCEQKGVRLLTIYDDVEAGIESINEEGLWLLIHEDIGLQRTNIELISDVLHKVFEMVQIEFDLSEDEIRDIRKRADLEVRKMSTTEFKEKAEKKNSTVEVLGEYSSCRAKVKSRCRRCGGVWESEAGNLLAGHGCPKKRKH